VAEDIPQIMTDSFRHFILSEVNEAEIQTQRQEAGASGAWNQFKVPFFIVILLVLLFVFITQQETFNKLLGILTAFAAGIPVILKLFQHTQSGKSS
jgi:hypothetical protein